jgi:Uma2 family endonuclease
MAIQDEHWISLEEYHEIERNSEVKYEYADGHIYEMSGETVGHSRIAINLITALGFRLRETACRVFNSDMKVLPSDNENPSYYPDVTVTCNPDDYRDDSTAIRSPRLIIEVLSPSTFARDRDEKLDMYHACPTVEEYVMVSSHHQEVEVYRRESAREWADIQYTTPDAVITLASVGLQVPMAEIYAQTDLQPLGLPESVFYPY